MCCVAERGVDHHLIERCLNHQPKSLTPVALVYNRHGYKEKMRAAWMLWADRVTEIVEGKKSTVVRIY